jgi:hypothetical protein
VYIEMGFYDWKTLSQERGGLAEPTRRRAGHENNRTPNQLILPEMIDLH